MKLSSIPDLPPAAVEILARAGIDTLAMFDARLSAWAGRADPVYESLKANGVPVGMRAAAADAIQRALDAPSNPDPAPIVLDSWQDRSTDTLEPSRAIRAALETLGVATCGDLERELRRTQTFHLAPDEVAWLRAAVDNLAEREKEPGYKPLTLGRVNPAAPVQPPVFVPSPLVSTDTGSVPEKKKRGHKPKVKGPTDEDGTAGTGGLFGAGEGSTESVSGGANERSDAPGAVNDSGRSHVGSGGGRPEVAGQTGGHVRDGAEGNGSKPPLNPLNDFNPDDPPPRVRPRGDKLPRSVWLPSTKTAPDEYREYERSGRTPAGSILTRFVGTNCGLQSGYTDIDGKEIPAVELDKYKIISIMTQQSGRKTYVVMTMEGVK